MKQVHTLITALVAAALILPGMALADVDEDVEELLDRVDELELRTAKNKISFFGDFRVKYDYVKWNIPAYQQFMGMDFSDPQNPQMVYMPVPEQEAKNAEAWSARLRLKMQADISKELHFTGRLNMNRAFGGSAVPIFNGFPNTVLTGFNSTSLAGDDALHVERAAFTYNPRQIPLFFTLGRQAATGGPPRELRENRVRQGTPGALMIDAQIDGAMIGISGGELGIGLPDEAILRFCYGTGFEAGFGSGGATKTTYVTTYVPNVTNPQQPVLFAMPNPVSGLKDSKVAGFCAETPIPPIPGNSLLTFGYFRMLDMTDIPYGEVRSFPNPFSTQPQVVTATVNLGDMDLFGACFQHAIDIEDVEVDWFASIAVNKSQPDAGTASLYGFGPLLGNSGESIDGMCYFVGARSDFPPTGGKIGIEFNHGDENWFSYTPAADDVNAKLSTRGNVFEAYYIQPLTKGLDLRIGFQNYTYTHAFSGWHISPAPIEFFDLEENPRLPYGYPDQIQNLHVVFDLNF